MPKTMKDKEGTLDTIFATLEVISDIVTESIAKATKSAEEAIGIEILIKKKEHERDKMFKALGEAVFNRSGQEELDAMRQKIEVVCDEISKLVLKKQELQKEAQQESK